MPTRRPSATRQLTRLDSARTARPRRRAVPAKSRQTSVLLVRWGLAAICVYLLVTGDGRALVAPIGMMIVAALAGSNLVLARMRPQVLEGAGVTVAIAVLDALLVVTAWYLSGYESFTPVILSLCLLNLALVGVSLGEIAAVALAASILYSIISQAD